MDPDVEIVIEVLGGARLPKVSLRSISIVLVEPMMIPLRARPTNDTLTASDGEQTPMRGDELVSTESPENAIPIRNSPLTVRIPVTKYLFVLFALQLTPH